MQRLVFTLLFCTGFTTSFAQTYSDLHLNSTSSHPDFWNVDFTEADSIAFHYEGYSLKHPDQLADSLVRDLHTDVEKFRAIFRWITENIAYNYRLYNKIISKEKKWKHNRKRLSVFSQRASKKNFKSMIRHKKAICSGYATLLDYMCSHVGIESVFISGYSRTYGSSRSRPDHAWNAVKLEGKWYLCDVTWASGFVDPHVGRFFKRYSNVYFLTDPSLLIANHYPNEVRWSLLKEVPSLSQFLTSAFKAEGFITNKINTYSPLGQTVRVRINEKFEVKFTSNSDDIGETVDLILNKKTHRSLSEGLTVTLKKNEIGEFIIETSFPEKGAYFVYVFINRIETLVYEVFVY